MDLGPFLRLLLYQTGDLILYAAVLPALAAAVMVGIGFSRRAAEPERLYAAVALPSVLAVLGSGVAVSSTYGIDGSTGLNERYVFSVVPLLLLGLALWIHAGLPRPRWALPLVVIVALVPALLPWDALEVDASLYAQSLAPWVALPLGRIGTGIVVAAGRARRGVVVAALAGRAGGPHVGRDADSARVARPHHARRVLLACADGARRLRRDPP